MRLEEAILRACEEYTSKIQELKDYIASQNNRIDYTVANAIYCMQLDASEWDYVLTLKCPSYTLEFAQFDEDEPIAISLKSHKGGAIKKQTTANTAEQIIDAAQGLFKLAYEKEEHPEIDDIQCSVNVTGMQQCVLKIKDIGNEYAYLAIVEDNTYYKNPNEMEHHYADRIAFDTEEDPTIQWILAYHEEGSTEFYDFDTGTPLGFDMSYNDKFNKDYQKAIRSKENTVPFDRDKI